MLGLASSVLSLLICAGAATGTIKWNDPTNSQDGHLCLNVNADDEKSPYYKVVRMSPCTGEGEQQFYQDGQYIKWKQNGWCLGPLKPVHVDGGDYAYVLDENHGYPCATWKITCPSHNDCHYQTTATGYMDTDAGCLTHTLPYEGNAYGLWIGNCGGPDDHHVLSFTAPASMANTTVIVV